MHCSLTKPMIRRFSARDGASVAMQAEPDSFIRGLLNALPEHAAIIDDAGVIVCVNEAWREFARRNGAAGLAGEGSAYLEVCRKASLNGDRYARQALDGLESVLAGATEAFTMAYPCHSPGEERWFTLHATRINAVPGGALLRHANVTHRKLAEDKLREREARQAFLLELTDALRGLDEPQEITQTACEMLARHIDADRAAYVQISGEEFIFRESHARGSAQMQGRGPVAIFGRTMIEACRRGEMVWSDDCDLDPRFSEPEREAFRHFGARAFIGATLIRNGEWVGAFGVDSVAPRRWSESERELVGEAAARIWAAAERARAERAQRESEEKYRALFESIDEGYCILEAIVGEADRVQDFRFLEANPAYLRIVDVAGVSIVGRRGRELFSIEDEWLCAVGEAALRRERVHHEGESKALNRWLDAFFMPFGAPGSSLCAVRVSDTTERRRAEQKQREYAEMLLEADRRKDEFLATLAHELRNPLAPIRNAVYLQERYLAEGSGAARLPGLLEIMRRQTDHLVRLVDDLLEISRINRGVIELHKEPVELAAVLRQAAETSAPAMEAGGHEFVLDLPDEPICFLADPVRLTQVFANLIDNAAKYTPPGGAIALRARREDGQAIVSVKDDGVGISAEMLPRVFDLFARGDGPRHRTQGGLGIGLSLVRSLAEQHGGAVEARSAGEGAGAEFIVRLPLMQASSEALKEPRPATPAPLASLRVVVADDNRDAADSLGLMLKEFGAVARVVYDGRAALEAVKELSPDLVILDLGMKDMDGIETARRIRALPQGKKAMIAALTGWGQAEQRQRTHEAGFDRHLVKPAAIDDLGQLLREAAE
ncbi:hybrid sensor histidine kinase/response regulator [Methylocystis heyeri]|uniref:histidine kinase n=1 Tax=Methylocystis heyeri TaxID=391905 RepID=A0A6B8KBK2_9HYPH|nr:ATP-binding protein [Methylocystis heyeri]QGM45784.1 response regulator [Methylocystis heyeri]